MYFDETNSYSMLCCYFINYHRFNYHYWNINNVMKQTHTRYFISQTNNLLPSAWKCRTPVGKKAPHVP